MSVHITLFYYKTSTTNIYSLSLHDALPISNNALTRAIVSSGPRPVRAMIPEPSRSVLNVRGASTSDRKSTRLNSSHGYISYAVFCLKKKSELGQVGGNVPQTVRSAASTDRW